MAQETGTAELAETAEVRHEVVVGVSPATAYEAFLRLDLVKPKDHNLLQAPIAETVVERRVGGAITDRGTDGSECRWGRVLALEPPDRFVFSWDIGPDWQVVDDLDRASEVEVTFTAEGEGTRVVLVHRHLDRHGAGWQQLRDGVGDENGWPLYLRRMVAVATGADPDA